MANPPDPTTNDLESRLRAAIEKRNRLADEVRRIEARRDLARSTLADVEAEIRKKGFEPDTIHQAVETLRATYQREVAEFESALAAADGALAPYRK